MQAGKEKVCGAGQWEGVSLYRRNPKRPQRRTQQRMPCCRRQSWSDAVSTTVASATQKRSKGATARRRKRDETAAVLTSARGQEQAGRGKTRAETHQVVRVAMDDGERWTARRGWETELGGNGLVAPIFSTRN